MRRTYVEFGNKHFKDMSVVFSGHNHDILTLFLTSEITNFSSEILEEFRRVISGTSGSAGFCGNIIELEFDSERADLYYNIPTSDSNSHYSIATSLLYSLVLEWLEMHESYKKGDLILPLEIN